MHKQEQIKNEMTGGPSETAEVEGDDLYWRQLRQPCCTCGALIRKIEKTKIGCFHYHKRLKNGAGILCRVDVFSSNIHGDDAVFGMAGACVKLPPASIISKSLSLTSF
jgi:hypothetical protein